MSTAQRIYDEFVIDGMVDDYVEFAHKSRRLAVIVDQDWDTGQTYYEFEDGSVILWSGSDVTVVEYDPEH